jgi:hypothetical protein
MWNGPHQSQEMSSPMMLRYMCNHAILKQWWRCAMLKQHRTPLNHRRVVSLLTVCYAVLCCRYTGLSILREVQLNDAAETPESMLTFSEQVSVAATGHPLAYCPAHHNCCCMTNWCDRRVMGSRLAAARLMA